MAVEPDAEHVEGLALHGVGAGPQVERGRHDGVALGHLHPDAEPAAGLEVDEVHDHLEALRGHALRQGAVRVGQVVDAGEVEAQLVAVVDQRLQQREVAVAA